MIAFIDTLSATLNQSSPIILTQIISMNVLSVNKAMHRLIK